MSHFNVIYPLCYLNRYTVNKNFTIKLNRWACLIIIAIPELRGDFLSWVMLSYKIHLPSTFKTAHGYLSRPGSARGLFPLRASSLPPLFAFATRLHTRVYYWVFTLQYKCCRKCFCLLPCSQWVTTVDGSTCWFGKDFTPDALHDVTLPLIPVLDQDHSSLSHRLGLPFILVSNLRTSPCNGNQLHVNKETPVPFPVSTVNF